MTLFFQLMPLACSNSEIKPFHLDETGSQETDRPDTSDINNPNDTSVQSADDCITASGHTNNSAEWIDGAERVDLSITDPDSCLRLYTLQSTQSILDNMPDNPRTYSETEDNPVVRTGHDLFDALYALAIVEVQENSVDAIQDEAFNNGEPISCPTGGCFETGRKWPYVWTRDIAYSAYLSLALLDPTRTRNSLEYKLSTRRDDSDLQIVQDTGTGGSYPVSTDRVVWAMGAWETLKFLDGQEREAFLSKSYEAMKNTTEHDRVVIWDAEDGLYSGEMSFLDWREQSYPSFTASDPAQIAMSKSLSTNTGHLHLLEITSKLALEQGLIEESLKYESWAVQLRLAIESHFWLDSLNGFSGYIPSRLDLSATHRMDLLGNSLAILSDLGTLEQRRNTLSSYPHMPKGAPVIWPQQQFTPIYHNRGIWPFVTAFWIKAAKSEHHSSVVTEGVYTLMRTAAMNLSNMENIEAATGLPYKGDEGEYSGPVVNSQRQLWSVAGYAAMVQSVIFGFEATQDGIQVSPFITNRLRRELFAGSDQIALSRLPYKGGKLAIVLNLGPQEDNDLGALIASQLTLNGVVVPLGEISHTMLTGNDIIEVTLGQADDVATSITQVNDIELQNYHNLYGPQTPNITDITSGENGLSLSIDIGAEDSNSITLDIYRDGSLVATDLPGSIQTWTDTEASQNTTTTRCYTIQSKFTSGNHSQHAKAYCWWGDNYSNIHSFESQSFEAIGGSLVYNYGEWHYEGWGASEHSLKVTGYTPSHNGEHLIQLRYGNGSAPISTGIYCGIKRITVYENGQEVGHGYAQMPQLGDWDQWSDSSFVTVSLEAGKAYDIVVDEDAYAINMSQRSHFETYSGSGGSSGPINFVNISALKVLKR